VSNPLSENEILILTRLLGTREFVAGAEAESAALGRLSVATETTGRAFTTASRRGFVMNQALFTMRRLVYGMSLAFIGFGIAATKWGFDYNNAMQTARVALRPFFDSNEDLNKSLQRLWTIAKFTPFQIKDMTTAFRALYPSFSQIGISADETIDALQAVIDGLSVAGKVSGPALNRVTIALQHLAFQGRLTGITTTTLARDGIPIYAILRKELGLTADQMHQIGRLGIPAQTALQAIIHYMQTTPGYAGAAERQSLHTLTGIWSTFKDNMSALMGSLEKGFFNRIQDNLASANHWFNQFTTSIQGATSVSDFLNKAIGPNAVLIWTQFANGIQDAFFAFRDFVGYIMRSQIVWGTILGILILLRGATWFLRQNTVLLAAAVKILLPLWILWHTYLKIATIWTGLFSLSEAALTATTRELTFAQFLAALALGRYQIIAKTATAITWLFTAAQIAFAAATDYLVVSLMAAAVWLELNPLVLLLTAIVAVTAGLVILYFKWQRFHDAVNSTVQYLYNHPFVALFVPVVGVLINIVHLLVTVFNWIQKIKNQGGTSAIGSMLPHSAGGWLRLAGRAATFPSTGLLQLIPGVPHFASGGVAPGGMAWVGERGPELLNLPRGTTVTPAGSAPAEAARQMNLRPLVIQVMMPDKRVLAEAVTDVLATDGART
jgi:hypothetical protein